MTISTPGTIDGTTEGFPPTETIQDDNAQHEQNRDQVRDGVENVYGEFVRRQIGPSAVEIAEMLKIIGYDSLDELMRAAIPEKIRSRKPLALPPALSEDDALAELEKIASKNEERRNYIGMGYNGTKTPDIILRMILEDPGWVTSYTPYQAEISQGRLEAMLNFQTMIADLSGMEVANASLLDEGTAAAEAMAMAYRISKGKKNIFYVASDCHPQTIEVIKTRALSIGIEVKVQDPQEFKISENTFGILVQYPNTDGSIEDYEELCSRAKENGALAIVGTDPLALTTLRPPGEFGADIVYGSTQRFGAPMGFGGPHAAFLACNKGPKKRWLQQMPGRLVGISQDSHGNPALRLTKTAREQHIRRAKATSNICTSQALMAVVASMYGVHHGPDGLKEIADRIHKTTEALASGLKELGYKVPETPFFDTIKIPVSQEQKEAILNRANEQQINLRVFDNALGISLDETTTVKDIQDLLTIFDLEEQTPNAQTLFDSADSSYDDSLARTSKFMTHPVFNSYHSEAAMMRYAERLRRRDISLADSMIPLGSCTMMHNSSSSQRPITWPKFANIHPFAPSEQTEGYKQMIEDLESWLAEITGMHSVSLQPNAGSQGEYSGLLIIKKYHEEREEPNRNICLIPHSAHGTNPASSTMAGMKPVEVDCDKEGNISFEDLKAKVDKHKDNLAAVMITYPSTHGVYETNIKEIYEIIHEAGGQVYLDGANMNALAGYSLPGEYADVIHLNLHKTFGLPHGGGGPGVGPIAVGEHLKEHLPNNPIVETGGEKSIGPIASAPWGSASILPIAWMYIRMMGAEGIKLSTATAVLNANYLSRKLANQFPTLYTGPNGLVAHECILDPRRKKSDTETAKNIAKRYADAGIHAPTMSFPIPGTLMAEPTGSESKVTLDAFIEVTRAIREEIDAVLDGTFPEDDNPLVNAPHTAESLLTEEWTHPYTRKQAAYPTPEVRDNKYWPPVGRVDDTFGDRNLVLTRTEEF